MRMLIVLTVLLGLAAPVLAVESRSLPSSAVPGYLAGPQAPLVSSTWMKPGFRTAERACTGIRW